MKVIEEGSAGLTRRDFLYLSGIGMAGLTLAGTPELGRAGEKKPKRGGVLRFAYRAIPTGLDAHKNQDYANVPPYAMMYSGLTEYGKLPQVEIHPLLAKSWEISGDGKEYSFLLREGVKFHHGKELDSADVKYSLDRVLNPATRSPKAYAFRWIESVQAIDKYNVRIRLKAPFAPFLSTLTVHNCPIIPAGWEPTGMKPAPGTGPFVFKSFLPNERFEVSRFDQYYEVDEKTGDRLPYLEGILLQKIVDETQRINALRAGDVEWVQEPPHNFLARSILEKPVPGIDTDYIVVGNQLIWFNVTKPPFNNKKVRQAIACAIDKKEFLRAMHWGLGKTINHQPFIDESRFYIPVGDREVDLAKAKQLMAEAGYPDGFNAEFFEYSVTSFVSGASIIVGQLQKIGIKGTLKVVDRAPYFSQMRKGEYSISFGSYDERFDWDDAFYMFFHSSEIGTNNWPRYSNKDLDPLLEKARTTLKMEDRLPLYKQVIETLKEDLPVHYICKSVTGNARSQHVQGYRKGFGSRFAWHGGGAKYWWLDR